MDLPPYNQRIEGWWSLFRRNNSTWWINMFKDAMERDIFTPGNEVQIECLWFCFSGVIQTNLNRVKDHWNSHYIRRSRHETIAGRPNELYFYQSYTTAKISYKTFRIKISRRCCKIFLCHAMKTNIKIISSMLLMKQA